MSNKLLNYHKNLKSEFKELLNSFNILFFGYGCKKNLLKEMFPKAIMFDGLSDSISYINSSLKEKQSYASKSLTETKEILLIIHNFSFDKFHFLKETKNIKIIGTVEKINYTFSQRDINDYNFIFRDLTTFIPYKDNLKKKENLEANKLREIENIFINISKQSQILFCELIKCFLENNKVTISDLFCALKHKLMLKSKVRCFQLLNEFVDHKILKINEEEVIHLNVSSGTANDFYERNKEIK